MIKNGFVWVVGYPLFVFLIWLGLGFLFRDPLHGFLAGLGFGLFYFVRLLKVWFE